MFASNGNGRMRLNWDNKEAKSAPGQQQTRKPHMMNAQLSVWYAAASNTIIVLIKYFPTSNPDCKYCISCE